MSNFVVFKDIPLVNNPMNKPTENQTIIEEAIRNPRIGKNSVISHGKYSQQVISFLKLSFHIY